MLARITLAALAMSATVAVPAHAVDVPLCTATAPAGHNRAYCTFTGPPGNYKVTITSYFVRYAWARIDCVQGGITTSVEAGAWDTPPDNGYAQDSATLLGGDCTLTVAAGASTSPSGTGHAIGWAYYVV